MLNMCCMLCVLRALEAANKLPGEASERQRMVASCHNCHCEALRELGRLQEAEDECVKGLHIREKVSMDGKGHALCVCILAMPPHMQLLA